MNIRERQGSIRSHTKFNKVDEDNIDLDQDIAKLKTKLMVEFGDVFKRDLGPDNRLNIPPVVVEVVDNPNTPYNCMPSIETAVKEELSRLLKS